MKFVRLLLLGTGVVVALLLVAAGVACNSSFQTWLARRTLGSPPGWRTSIGSVSAGLQRVEAADLRFERDGAVLILPRVDADIPVLKARWEQKLMIRRLSAKGWTLDLSRATGIAAKAAVPMAAVESLRPDAARAPQAPKVASSVGATTWAFDGLLAQLAWPMDLSIDGLELEGEVIWPEPGGRSKVTISGGGIDAGRDGRFEFTARSVLSDDDVKTLQVRGELVVATDAMRRLVRVESKFSAFANGRNFPEGVKVQTALAAARTTAGESYSVAMVANDREMLNVIAAFDRDSRRLDGSWKLNVRDGDLAPFTTWQSSPVFAGAGQGTVGVDSTFSAIRVTGRVAGTVDRLEKLRPQLATLGELRLEADFDLSGQGGLIGVRKFESAIKAAQPIASVRGLQAFDFNPRTGELRAADPARELLGIGLHGVPLAWVKTFFKDVELSGEPLRGELVATPRGGGIALRTVAPITVGKVNVSHAGAPVAGQVDLRFSALADYSPLGWQAEVHGATASRGDTTWLTLDAKAGQLAGDNQAVKATGKISANLPVMLTQPFAAGRARLSRGDAFIDFAASMNASAEVQASVRLENLGTMEDDHMTSLPAVSFDLRADVGPDGKIAFNTPVVVERNGRKSDLTVTGTIGPEKDRTRTIDAKIQSTHLVVEDGEVFAAVVPPRAKGSEPRLQPPWVGWQGSLGLQFRNIVCSDALSVGNVSGLLRFEGGVLKLEGGQAALGESGRVAANGSITFDAREPRPFGITADVSVKEFDPRPLLRHLSHDAAFPLEGRFDLVGKLTGRARTLDELTLDSGGEYQLTSKSGLFRGLPVTAKNLVETPGRLAGIFSSAGSMLIGLTGRKDPPEIANRSEAAAEFARGLNPIAYDQLSVRVSRDAALNTVLTEFTLISPEFRVTGNGTVLHKPGHNLLDDSLAMEFKLRARGRQGDLLKYLGVLDPKPDDLGYSACTLPLNITGTLGKLDASDVNSRLAALTIEKGGLTDKAADLLNRIRGVTK